MKSMIIRRWTEEDAVPWELLLDAGPSHIDSTKYLIRGELWIAELHDQIIGEMVLMPTRIDIVEIMNIATAEEFRNQGVGAQLVNRAVPLPSLQRIQEVQVVLLMGW